MAILIFAICLLASAAADRLFSGVLFVIIIICLYNIRRFAG